MVNINVDTNSLSNSNHLNNNEISSLNDRLSLANGNGCKTVDNDINNATNSNSDINVTFSCDSDNVNNSVTGVVLNDIMILPYDDGDISNILNQSSE